MADFEAIKPAGTQATFAPTNQSFTTGAIRGDAAGKGRFDLISPIAEQRLALHLEVGGKHYGDRNWEKGIPLHRYVDSLKRHLNQWLQGKTDEDHLAALLWNAHALLHTDEMIRRGQLPASLDDIPRLLSFQQVVYEKGRKVKQFAENYGAGPQKLNFQPIQPHPLGGKWPTLPPTPFSGPSMPSSPKKYKLLTLDQVTKDGRQESEKLMGIREFMSSNSFDGWPGGKDHPGITANVPGGYPKWVKDHMEDLRTWAPTVYVSGPYSSPTLVGRLANCMVAGYIGYHLTQLGYNVIVPHLMTHWLEGGTHPGQHLRTDFHLLRSSRILFRQGPSVGSDAELEQTVRLNEFPSWTHQSPKIAFSLREFWPVKSSVPMTLPRAYGDKLTMEVAYEELLAFTKRALATEAPDICGDVLDCLCAKYITGELGNRLFVPDAACQKHSSFYYHRRNH